MNKPNSPCLDCTDRQLGCHSSCSKYTKYKNMLNAFNETVVKSKQQYYDYNHNYSTYYRVK